MRKSRAKKIPQQQITEIVADPIIEKVVEKTPAKPTNGLGYTGTINISLSHNGRVVLKNKYHNAGSLHLFEFLSKCITGQFSTSSVPKFIRLFTFENEPAEIPTGIILESQPVGASVAFNLSTIENNDTDISSSAILHFTIPGSACHIAGESNEVRIYQVGLYSADNVSDQLEYSAAFNLVAEGGLDWNPITFNLNNGDYTIYIEWALEFSNK